MNMPQTGKNGTSGVKDNNSKVLSGIYKSLYENKEMQRKAEKESNNNS